MYRQLNPNNYGSLRYSTDYALTSGFLTKEILNKYEQLCEKSKDNKIKDNSTIYLSPISDYPTYKLKNYIQENKLNINKARKWDKIDTIIIDKDILNNIKTKENKIYNIIPASELHKDKDKYWDKNNFYYNKTNEYSDTSFFYTETENISLYPKDFKQFHNYPQIEGIPILKNHGNKKIYDNIKFITELFENIEKHNIYVVLDSSINKEINKDTTVDLETYETLYNMLNSTDENNTIIAKEIIANCEYDQSRPYILFLSSIFSKLWTKSNNKNYHSVHKFLIKERKHFDCWNYKANTHFEIIQKILEKSPEYKIIFSKCMKIHLNTLYKVEIVKEIVSF